MRRSLRRGVARATALAVGAIIANALLVSPGTAVTSMGSSGNSALGTKSPAKGTPVKIGFVTNGVSGNIDQRIEQLVAEPTVKWLNEYGKGLGGHPIELDMCIDSADPSKAGDCANQMIRDKVAAVVIGANAVIENVWTPLRAAGIPVFIYASVNPNIVADTASTFVMTNGRASNFSLPVGAAKKARAKKVSVVAIDVPAATAFFKGPGPALYQKEGLQLELIPVPAGTADMTPQMQRLTSDNPKGVVFVLGNDSFCTAAFNGLRTAGFKGTITTIPNCFSDATRTAVPADFLKGMQIAAQAPFDDPKAGPTRQYNAVLDRYATEEIDRSNIRGLGPFMAFAGMNMATKNLKGEATPAAIIAATKAMPWSELPGTGLHFRCNGNADPDQPAVCSNNTYIATLDAAGKAKSYTPVGDSPIPG
jgi:branched-chain amino acid transport system substrate-binding protein